MPMPHEQHEHISHAQRVDSMTLGVAAVLTEEYRSQNLLEHDNSGPPHNLRAEQSNGLAENNHDALEDKRAKAIYDARDIIGNFLPEQRRVFDHFMNTTAPSSLRHMRESEVAESAERTRVPTWSAWASGEAGHGATDEQLLNLLQWYTHTIGELQTSKEFKEVETDAKEHLYASVHEWSDRGLVSTMPKSRRIMEASVKVGDPIMTVANSTYGYYLARHDPNSVVVAPGVGRTTYEQVESMKRYGVEHILLHELWHYAFDGPEGQDEWWMREGLAEFATICMDTQDDVSKQTPEDHSFLLAEGGYPEVRKLLHVLATQGERVVDMGIFLRSYTSIQNSRERMVLDRELDAAWGMPNTRSTVDTWIRAGTAAKIGRILADPKRIGPDSPTDTEIWLARLEATAEVSDSLLSRNALQEALL